MLLLTLSTFSLTGGIEKVNKILCKVLKDCAIENNPTNLEVLSLCDQTKHIDTRYINKENFKGYSGSKIPFAFSAIKKGLQHDVILLTHVNLLFIALVIRFFNRNKRIILVAHGIEVWRNLRYWKASFLKKNIEIWAVSKYTAQILATKHQINIEQITVVNNCLDPYFNIPKTFSKPGYLLKRHHITPDQPVLLTISRLSSFELYKGYDFVIASIAKLIPKYPKLVYLLAGKADEKEKSRINQYILHSKLENHIILVDYVEENELTDYFLLADTFIMPSKKEGFGIVFIEAAACGCKVIAGNLDGSTDALLNGDLGTLINPRSLEAVKTAICANLDKPFNPEHSKQLQEKTMAHFSYEKYQQTVIELINMPLHFQLPISS
ncbi:glycosyltransferase family 4 protein [Pedobacter sp. MW01-1-1]|uniref:glycosyltransferase family 4 protein n=1 Tax=Pedobacter sp. MW01-1-1 TaxID=3383027 RepID=UPI003FEF73C4